VDVTGRGVSDQVSDTLDLDVYQLPQVHEGDNMWTVIQREGAESHAMMVEAFYEDAILQGANAPQTAATVQAFLARPGNERMNEYAELFEDAGWFSEWLS
jgi:hypothetical protein